jgi:hypothetical protein
MLLVLQHQKMINELIAKMSEFAKLEKSKPMIMLAQISG